MFSEALESRATAKCKDFMSHVAVLCQGGAFVAKTGREDGQAVGKVHFLVKCPKAHRVGRGLQGGQQTPSVGLGVCLSGFSYIVSCLNGSRGSS